MPFLAHREKFHERSHSALKNVGQGLAVHNPHLWSRLHGSTVEMSDNVPDSSDERNCPARKGRLFHVRGDTVGHINRYTELRNSSSFLTYESTLTP